MYIIIHIIHIINIYIYIQSRQTLYGVKNIERRKGNVCIIL